MTATVGYRQTTDGLTLLERHWSAASARATVLIVHGLGEHSGRYEHVGARLADAGYDTRAIDLRSFGRSGGRTRSYVEAFERFLDDVEALVVQARTEGRPVAVLGHSMGGLIVTAYAVSGRPQPAAYVVSAPLLGVEAPRWQRMLSRLLTRLAPRVSIPNNIDAATLSRDVAVQQAYDADPLVQHGVTVRLGAEMFRAMDATSAALDHIVAPMLVLHGAEDVLVHPRYSAPLGGVESVRRELLAGLRHEIFNEPEGDEVLDRVIEWLDTTVV